MEPQFCLSLALRPSPGYWPSVSVSNSVKDLNGLLQWLIELVLETIFYMFTPSLLITHQLCSRRPCAGSEVKSKGVDRSMTLLRLLGFKEGTCVLDKTNPTWDV